jgi:hypothetical protein
VLASINIPPSDSDMIKLSDVISIFQTNPELQIEERVKKLIAIASK